MRLCAAALAYRALTPQGIAAGLRTRANWPRSCLDVRARLWIDDAYLFRKLTSVTALSDEFRALAEQKGALL